MKNSLKEKIRYWFEFLKIAHDASDPVVKGQLLKSADFYAPWGNYRDQRFNEWWKTHSSLFKNSDVLSVPKSGDVVTDDAFYVRVPYTYAPSTVGKIVAEMYERGMRDRVIRSKKMKKVYDGTFSLSREDYQVAQFHYYLVFLRDVYLPIRLQDPDGKTRVYIDKSKEVFRKLERKTTDKRRVPFTNQKSSYESESRLVSRYRKLAEKLLLNVSLGVFPGDYEEAFIKNQSQIRAQKAASTVQNGKKVRRGPPSSLYTVHIDRKSGVDPYSEVERKTRSDKGVKRTKSSSD